MRGINIRESRLAGMDIRPQIAAAAIFAAFDALQDDDGAAPAEPFSPEDARAAIDEVMTFLRGGFEALRGS